MNEAGNQPCPVCQNENVNPETLGNDSCFIKCRSCGEFTITLSLFGTLRADPDVYGERWILSGVLRASYERGVTLGLHTANVKSLIESAQKPEGPFESMDLILMHVYEHSQYAGAATYLFDYDYPIAFAKNVGEFHFLIQQLANEKLISREPDGRFTLTLDGWKRVRELKQRTATSNQAFVAMWFDAEMNPSWKQGFEPALTQAQYNPFRVDLDEHNGKIDDHIIANIRKSGLLVADFTGNRGGVYFEAGFAMGLGVPVIWTCRTDHENKLHFDTRQYNHILWATPKELKKKLTARIEATLPKRD